MGRKQVRLAGTLIALSFVLLACAPSPILNSPPPESTDPEFQAAIQQARGTLDLFTAKIQTPHPDRTYTALKVRFTSPDESTQDIWVDHVTYEDGGFQGSMGDDIPALKLSFDDRIPIPVEDIIDWMIVEDGKLIGGFTIRLEYERMSPEEKQQFLEGIDYSIED